MIEQYFPKLNKLFFAPVNQNMNPNQTDYIDNIQQCIYPRQTDVMEIATTK